MQRRKALRLCDGVWIMGLIVKIIGQTKRPCGMETTLGFYEGERLVRTKVVTGTPSLQKMDFLAQKVQYKIDNPIVEEKLYTQEEVDKLIADAVKEAEIGR